MAEVADKKLEGEGGPGQGYTYSPRYWRKRVNKNGNSLHVNLPHPMVRDLNLAHGAEVLVYIVGRVICIQPASMEPFWPEVVSVRPAGKSGQQSAVSSQEGEG